MPDLRDHDSPRTWGPQTTAIPVGGTIAWMWVYCLVVRIALLSTDVARGRFSRFRQVW